MADSKLPRSTAPNAARPVCASFFPPFILCRSGVRAYTPNVVIDRRPAIALSGSPTSTGVQVIPPMSTLMPLEVDALRHAISDEQLKNMGWTVDAKTGRVSKGGHAIFRAGFITAIKKVLDAVIE